MKCVKCKKEVSTWQKALYSPEGKIEIPPHCSDCKDIVFEKVGLNPHGLMPREETKPAIPDENIESIIDLSDDVAIWCKLVPGGFQFANQDKTVKELVGQIVTITPYLINFDAGDRTPAKLPHVKSDLEIPEGYSRRCDVKIVSGGQVIGLSLAPSSTKFQLSPYLKYLKNQGLRPEDVVTRITSKTISNALGTFQVAVFEMVGLVDESTAKKVTPAINSEETPPETPLQASVDASFPEEWA